MKVFLTGKNTGVDAIGDYNPETKELKIFKGSIVSRDIAHSETFRGAKSIEKNREGNVEGSVLKKDIVFKSASTAANFVTGRSTNGMIAWKNSEGKTLKKILLEDKGND